MTRDDIPDLVEMERLAFSIPWTAEAFRHELDFNDNACYIGLVYDERLIGYCGMWIILDEAHITNVAIRPEFRGMGFGFHLMTYVMAVAHVHGADHMTLEVRPSNRSALRLYRKLGFAHVGTRPRYYPDDLEDAWIMWVKLNDDDSRN